MIPSPIYTIESGQVSKQIPIIRSGSAASQRPNSEYYSQAQSVHELNESLTSTQLLRPPNYVNGPSQLYNMFR